MTIAQAGVGWSTWWLHVPTLLKWAAFPLADALAQPVLACQLSQAAIHASIELVVEPQVVSTDSLPR